VGTKTGTLEKLAMTPTNKIHIHKYIWLDLIRALAAVEVFLSHLRGFMFKGYSAPGGIVKKVFYFITGFPHEAVIIFFVLSGYFITDAIVRAREKNNFSFLSYGLDRLVRLWIVLIPGLLLTLVVDKIGLHYFSSSAAYQGTIEFMGKVNVSSHLTSLNFIGNLFFVQTILVETFGSNSPMWSLSNEFWYYVMFPLFLFLFWRKKVISKITVFCVLAALILFVGEPIRLYFFVWLTGSALVFIKRNFRKPSVLTKNIILIVGVAAFVLFFYKIRMGGVLDFQKDFIAGLLMAVLLYCGLYSNIRFEMPKKIIAFLSGMSYSLYVIHLPLCIFLCSALNRVQADWSMKNFAIYILVTLLIFIISVLFWYLFESRYLQLRSYIKSKIFVGRGDQLSIR
jgi:peptidoglycan/LPS O-acetylase OafA/YrhL